MKKPLALFLTAALIITACAKPHLNSPAAPPTVPIAALDTIAKVAPSVSRVSIQTEKGKEVGSCTAFSIAPRKFITAAHCIFDSVEDMWGNTYKVKDMIDGHYASPVKVDYDKDLAVLLVDEVKPGLTLRDTPLALYEDVYGVGYGYGLDQFLVTQNRAEIFDYPLKYKETGKDYPGTIFMGSFIGGMSGGPIVDKNGEVVGVVQAGNDAVGFGVTTQTLEKFLTQ